MTTPSESQKDVLLHGLRHLENSREEMDLLMNCYRDPESTSSEMSDIAITILQNLRTVQFAIEEAIMIAEMTTEDETPETNKVTN